MTARREDRQLANLQASATEQDARLPAEERAVEVPEEREDKTPGIYAELAGEKFRLAEDTGVMALMEWAAAGDGEASEGAAVGSNLRAMFHVLEDIVHPEEWQRFRAHARAKKLGYQEFLDFQNRSYEALSGNPTE